ncbi:MAG TPA: thiamine pyrophosphate-dependent enzyme, partial [Chitinophagaceae bacterium]
VMLDGDGAVLMQMGSLPTIADHIKNNFVHIVINNGSHESVGGQPTEGFFADLTTIASASGYEKTVCISNDEELNEWLKNGLNDSIVQFVEIRTNNSSRKELGRPAGKPVEWRDEFMKQNKRDH